MSIIGRGYGLIITPLNILQIPVIQFNMMYNNYHNSILYQGLHFILNNRSVFIIIPPLDAVSGGIIQSLTQMD